MMLCALENVKALLGISGTESDAMLEILIKTQSALICAYIGFNPSIREYTEIQAVNNNQHDISTPQISAKLINFKLLSKVKK